MVTKVPPAACIIGKNFGATVRLTSTGNSVSEYRDFSFPAMETIVGQVEKIGSLTWGMAWRSILAEI